MFARLFERQPASTFKPEEIAEISLTRQGQAVRFESKEGRQLGERLIVGSKCRHLSENLFCFKMMIPQG